MSTAASSVLPPAFACSSCSAGADVELVHAVGELDVATSTQLKQSLHDAQARASIVVVDLREVVFIDCCGVRVIVSASRDAQGHGRRLVLQAGPSVDRVFTLTESWGDLEIRDAHPVEEGP